MRRSLLLLLVLLGWLGLAASVPAADQLVWRAGGERVDADLEGWTLPQLLEQIADVAGWQVFVQPGAQLKEPVSVRFKNLSTGEALGRLLNGLSFSVLPHSPPKLFVFRTSVADATQRVEPRDSGKAKPIADELVLLRKAGSKADADELAKKLGGKIIGNVKDVGAYRLKFENADAANQARAALNGNADFNVDFNYSLPRPAGADALTAATALPFTLKPDASAPAGQLIVGLIDQPVQKNTPYRDLLLPGLAAAGDTAPPGDTSPTHGTAMFETVLRGLANGAEKSPATSVRVLPVDVYGSEANASTFNVARGIVEAVNSGATIVNLSLGGAGDSTLLHSVITQAAARGVLFVAAAGNQPTTALTFPAAYPEVLAVTAATANGQLASYANRGEFVDVAAPGSSVIYFGGNAYLVSGTSASTAFVSGLAAALKANTGASADAIIKQLKQTLAVPPSSGN